MGHGIRRKATGSSKGLNPQVFLIRKTGLLIYPIQRDQLQPIDLEDMSEDKDQASPSIHMIGIGR